MTTLDTKNKRKLILMTKTGKQWIISLDTHHIINIICKCYIGDKPAILKNHPLNYALKQKSQTLILSFVPSSPILYSPQ